MYIFACHIYCRSCGGTNLEFYKPNKQHGWQKKDYVAKICKECYLEAGRRATKKYRSKISSKERKRLWDISNKEKVLDYKRKAGQKFREKLKVKNDLIKLQFKMVGIIPGKCHSCKKLFDPGVLSGKFFKFCESCNQDDLKKLKFWNKNKTLIQNGIDINISYKKLKNMKNAGQLDISIKKERHKNGI